jgi:hypothetical protein
MRTAPKFPWVEQDQEAIIILDPVAASGERTWPTDYNRLSTLDETLAEIEVRVHKPFYHAHNSPR